jgi:hypothetical protein
VHAGIKAIVIFPGNGITTAENSLPDASTDEEEDDEGDDGD